MKVVEKNNQVGNSNNSIKSREREREREREINFKKNPALRNRLLVWHQS
ncbi:hypothetical protein [endosymbiont DhMRE of Dentiscutata heterogama]|nr:hypothetical protein [endosymbiont DhMRE of Dentiscutata heterogama]